MQPGGISQPGDLGAMRGPRRTGSWKVNRGQGDSSQLKLQLTSLKKYSTSLHNCGTVISPRT